ncbi:MAG: hypothetical protein Kow0068_19750 [Marinilabiliales bacterium]
MRKTGILLVIILAITGILKSQDLIILKNGQEIKSKVLEITLGTIKYKDFDYQTGPTRNIAISDVFMIIYENGQREIFKSEENPVKKEEVVSQENEYVPVGYKGTYFMFGAGYGVSYGGLGTRIQWRIGDDDGVGVHMGLGYFPNAPVFASAGIKYFVFKDNYINMQFGLNGVEYLNTTIGTFKQNLYGPSLLVGGDWNWGREFGIGFNLAGGLSYYINADYVSQIAWALDIGVVVRY